MVTAGFVAARDAFIIYMKHPLYPGDRIDGPAEGVIFVIGYDGERRLECVADELEEGAFNTMMLDYLRRMSQNALQEKGQGSSKRLRGQDPIRYRWMFLEPPPSFTQMSDVLSRICFSGAWDKLAAKEGVKTKFIDLSKFTNVEAAIDRGTACMTYIQKIMAAVTPITRAK